MLMRCQIVYYKCGHFTTRAVQAMHVANQKHDLYIEDHCPACTRMRKARAWKLTCAAKELAGILTGDKKC